ncbi:hypothetical protein GDO81_024537 [Engystomops pustulosus]|uniref:Uncharacterized protein n=1 Tax=Engystomops pustulosus TaxID=76066 RepID=A0AAV6ZKJ1_ENGPU|nr:hypothetical protein GDO81_024537 [Engystomops pustulosus]
MGLEGFPFYFIHYLQFKDKKRKKQRKEKKSLHEGSHSLSISSSSMSLAEAGEDRITALDNSLELHTRGLFLQMAWPPPAL